MMKNKKIILILTMITILLGFNFCYAVDLDMTDDLADDLDLSAQNTNSSDDNSDTNTNTSNNTNNTNTNSNNTTTPNTTNTAPTGTPTTVSNINSKSNSGLEIATILNILLIVIGILLILLSIAILIRLKK